MAVEFPQQWTPRSLSRSSVLTAARTPDGSVALSFAAAHRRACRISRPSCASWGLTKMSWAPTVPSPSPAPAPLFVNRGTHSMPDPRNTEQSSSASGSLLATATMAQPSIRLPKRERVRLGAAFEEGDLERALADRVVRAHQLVHDDDATLQLGGAEWLGVEPLGRPAE